MTSDGYSDLQEEIMSTRNTNTKGGGKAREMKIYCCKITMLYLK